MSHYEHSLYKENRGRVYNAPTLPLPPPEGMLAEIRTYAEAPEEPVFDPKIHLDLQKPKYVRHLTDFKKTDKMGMLTENGGSTFAYSAPFQVRKWHKKCPLSNKRSRRPSSKGSSCLRCLD